MKLEEVLPALREGKKISRVDAWRLDDSLWYFAPKTIEDGSIKVYLVEETPQGKVTHYCFDICSGDFLADDWEVVDEEVIKDQCNEEPEEG